MMCRSKCLPLSQRGRVVLIATIQRKFYLLGGAFLVWLCNKLEDYTVVVTDQISYYEILEMAGV